MPAIGNLSVNDAETTPVAHVYAPVTTDGSRARFANRVGTTPLAYETLAVELRQPASSTGAYRLLIKANDPVTALVDGVDKVVKNSSADLAFNFSQLSTAQERKNLIQKMANALINADIVTVAEKCEPIY